MPPPPRNKALLGPYFLGGLALGGLPLDSHDKIPSKLERCITASFGEGVERRGAMGQPQCRRHDDACESLGVLERNKKDGNQMQSMLSQDWWNPWNE